MVLHNLKLEEKSCGLVSVETFAQLEKRQRLTSKRVEGVFQVLQAVPGFHSQISGFATVTLISISSIFWVVRYGLRCLQFGSISAMVCHSHVRAVILRQAGELVQISTVAKILRVLHRSPLIHKLLKPRAAPGDLLYLLGTSFALRYALRLVQSTGTLFSLVRVFSAGKRPYLVKWQGVFVKAAGWPGTSSPLAPSSWSSFWRRALRAVDTGLLSCWDWNESRLGSPGVDPTPRRFSASMSLLDSGTGLYPAAGSFQPTLSTFLGTRSISCPP
mmetsp:Transcript_34868/g.82720  ORF Transcript_34868/g.82720 Transcript_34868/m.82720 type:complete len:273 (+) Transcript_34868:215-1033(+)